MKLHLYPAFNLCESIEDHSFKDAWIVDQWAYQMDLKLEIELW